VGPLRVVVVHPLVHKLAHVGQRTKRIGVEQLTAERAVKALNANVLRWPTGLNPVLDDTLIITPFSQQRADKFGLVIGAQLHRSAITLDQTQPPLHHPLVAAAREPNQGIRLSLTPAFAYSAYAAWHRAAGYFLALLGGKRTPIRLPKAA
jgi:hypothetical protein